MGGHSDLLGGAVISREESGLFERVRDIQRSTGAVPSPQDRWLMLRSLRTLPWRMRAHNEHAVRIADFLEVHPAVDEVFFPGLKRDRKSTRLNSSHVATSYAVFCFKKKNLGPQVNMNN